MVEENTSAPGPEPGGSNMVPDPLDALLKGTNEQIRAVLAKIMAASLQHFDRSAILNLLGEIADRLLVIHGASGDLFRRKLLKAILRVFQEELRQGRPVMFRVLLTSGSMKIGDTEFNSCEEFLEAAARDKKVSGIKPKELEDLKAKGLWQRFVSLFEFVKADCSYGKYGKEYFNEAENKRVKDKDLKKVGYPVIAEKIREFKGRFPHARIHVYFSVPHRANLPTLANMQYLERDWCQGTWLLFEKPPETDPKRLQEMIDLLAGKELRDRGRDVPKVPVPLEQVGFVEHFVHKHGFSQFLVWMYKNRRRHLLNSKFVRRVHIKVHESVGSEGRGYPGVMMDSIVNHVFTILLAVLGDPCAGCDKRNVWRFFRQGLMELARQFHNRRNQVRGAYRFCKEDHGDTDRAFATAVLLSFRADVGDWGDTEFVLEHCKNSADKFIQVTFEFKAPDDGMLRFVVETVCENGVRYWGSMSEETMLLASEDSTEDQLIQQLTPVPHEIGDGYNGVISRCLHGDWSRFLSLEFHQLALHTWGEPTEKLDSLTAVGSSDADKERLPDYSRGSRPFDAVSMSRLADLCGF